MRVGDAGRGIVEYAIVAVVVCPCMLPRALAVRGLKYDPETLLRGCGSPCGTVDAIARERSTASWVYEKYQSPSGAPECDTTAMSSWNGCTTQARDW